MNKLKIEKIKIPNIKKIIIVASGKGGVGKSTIAAGIALALAKDGYATGLMDADIYGPSIPTLFNIHNSRPEMSEENGKTKIQPFIKKNIKLMSIGFFFNEVQATIWRGPMASSTLKQMLNDTEWGSLDYLIIDSPPGTGDVQITLLQQYDINGVIIVTTPQNIATSDVQKAVNLFQNNQLGIPVLGIVENMSWFSPSNHPEEKYFLFGKNGGRNLSELFNIPLISQIPMNENICNYCDTGKIEEILIDPQIKTGFDKIIDVITHPN